MTHEIKIEYEDFEVIQSYSDNEVRDSQLYMLSEELGGDDFNEGYNMAKKILLADARIIVNNAIHRARMK